MLIVVKEDKTKKRYKNVSKEIDEEIVKEVSN